MIEKRSDGQETDSPVRVASILVQVSRAEAEGRREGTARGREEGGRDGKEGGGGAIQARSSAEGAIWRRSKDRSLPVP